VEEEHHIKNFLYKFYKQKYGKLIIEMENDVFQKKDTFPKTVGDMCSVLAGWKYNYGIKYNWLSYVNDGVAFVTTEGPTDNGKNKK